MLSPSSATKPTAASLGVKLAHSIARQDFAQIAQLLHPAIDFRALTPRRVWEAATREDALEMLRTWFADCDIHDVLRVDTGKIAARHRVTYRYQGENPDGPFVVEQHAYYVETDGQISWIRLLCSGIQPQ
jgi:hypothetical protein